MSPSTSPVTDMEEVSITTQELIDARKEGAPKSLVEKANKANSWYKVRDERERNLIRKRKEDFLKEIKDDFVKKGASLEDLVAEIIEVDNDSCDPDGSYSDEFAPRYFGLEDNTYYEDVGDPDIKNDENEEIFL